MTKFKWDWKWFFGLCWWNFNSFRDILFGRKKKIPPLQCSWFFLGSMQTSAIAFVIASLACGPLTNYNCTFLTSNFTLYDTSLVLCASPIYMCVPFYVIAKAMIAEGNMCIWALMEQEYIYVVRLIFTFRVKSTTAHCWYYYHRYILKPTTPKQ